MNKEEVRKVIRDAYERYHVIPNVTFESFGVEEVIRFLESRGVDFVEAEEW